MIVTVVPLVKGIDDDAAKYPLETRGCLIETENHVGSLFRSYSQANCRMECSLKMLQEDKGCVPWDIHPFHEGAKCYEEMDIRNNRINVPFP